MILLLTYRSPVLWLLPLITAGVRAHVAQAVIYLLAKNAGLTVNGQSAGILTVLVFGAGTDYALLLVARYREELRRHEDRHEAMAVALHRAGPAIIASAATVRRHALPDARRAQLHQGPGAGRCAIGIAVGCWPMLTLLPALLVICGRWIFWPVSPRTARAEPTEPRASGPGSAPRVARRPRLVWIVTALVLGGLALGVTGLKADGLTNTEPFIDKPGLGRRRGGARPALPGRLRRPRSWSSARPPRPAQVQPRARRHAGHRRRRRRRSSRTATRYHARAR